MIGQWVVVKEFIYLFVVRYLSVILCEFCELEDLYDYFFVICICFGFRCKFGSLCVFGEQYFVVVVGIGV